MQVSADVSDFCAMVTEVRGRLVNLNHDGSFAGLIARFEHLLADLPSDFFVTEIVPAIDTGDVEPRSLFHVIVRAGPRLNALALALRALDLDAKEFHPTPPPSGTQESVSPLSGA